MLEKRNSEIKPDVEKHSVFRVYPDTSLRIGFVKRRDLAAKRIACFPVGLGALDAALTPPAFSRLCHDQTHFVARMGNMAVIAIDSGRHARVGNNGLSAEGWLMSAGKQDELFCLIALARSAELSVYGLDSFPVD